MVLISLRAQKMVLQNKFMTLMPLILLRSIVCPIALIWLSKHCQDYLWWCGLKVCCIVCTFILPTHLRDIWSSLRFRNSWQQRGTKNFEMSKQGGFQC
jgi:hypothetical protein